MMMRGVPCRFFWRPATTTVARRVSERRGSPLLFSSRCLELAAHPRSGGSWLPSHHTGAISSSSLLGPNQALLKSKTSSPDDRKEISRNMSSLAISGFRGEGLRGRSSEIIAHPPHQHQQQRGHRWTKAKKKSAARYQRRKEMAEKGLALPKPPYYFPKDTPVVNALTVEQQEQQRQKQDVQASAELHQHVVEQQPQQILRHHMSLSASLSPQHQLRMSDRVKALFQLRNGSQREVVQAQKQQAMQLFQLRVGDTGSSAVQVIALTTRIQQLQTHLHRHKKDRHSKRGLDALYVRRRKLLDYMERREQDAYRRVVKTLGLVR